MRYPILLMGAGALVAALVVAPALAEPDIDETAILASVAEMPVTASEADDLPAYLTDSPADDPETVSPETLTLTLVDDAAL